LEWRVVEIDPNGWRTIEGEKSPVRFRRIEGMTALPARIDGAVKQP